MDFSDADADGAWKAVSSVAARQAPGSAAGRPLLEGDEDSAAAAVSKRSGLTRKSKKAERLADVREVELAFGDDGGDEGASLIMGGDEQIEWGLEELGSRAGRKVQAYPLSDRMCG